MIDHNAGLEGTPFSTKLSGAVRMAGGHKIRPRPTRGAFVGFVDSFVVKRP